MTIEPQVVGVQDAGVAGAAGEGLADVDDIDIPPPQAFKAAVNKTHAAAGNQRRSPMRVWAARFEHCIEVSSVVSSIHECWPASPRLRAKASWGGDKYRKSRAFCSVASGK